MPDKQGEKKRKQRTIGLPHKHMLWGSAALIGLALFFLAGALYEPRWKSLEQPFDVVASSPVAARVARHPLTGAWLQEAIEPPRVFGVMIDNLAEARPQSGIDHAFLVIEAPVEASIPRMIAFFDASQNIPMIGPVRSARPYFIDWNNAFDALYTHVGGSNEALEKIVSGGTFDLNEFSHGSSFWRSTTRYAPHNTYTSSELLNEYLQERTDVGWAPEVLYESWQFKDAEPATESTDTRVSIDFWSPVYTVEWNYDFASGRYKRSQAGQEDQTLDGQPVFADNVVVVITDVSVLDAVGRRKVRTTGEGKATVMQDGKIVEATWKKPSASQRLRFFVGENEVRMNAGKTWIEVVPSLYDVTFGQE